MAREKKSKGIRFELVETEESIKNTSRNKANLAKTKKLTDYKQDKPIQLSLFELLLPNEKPYSNTIELYDFIPKYHWGKVERVNGTFLKSLDREFECRGKRYSVTVQPASLKDKNGEEKYYYPSKREELVEDALRKFAVEGQGLFLDDAAGVTFTLHQLQQELMNNGHTYSKDQIKDALLVCAKTNITVTSDDGSTVLVSGLFETLGLQTREDWESKGQKSKAFVRFNPLVTEGIKARKFRMFNYETSMSYKNVVARQLHKRLTHHYTQASISDPYSINLTTIIRDFGLTAYERLSHNLRDIEMALDEMTEKFVILNYKVEKTLDAEQRNKMIEAKVTIVPHPKFVSEIMQGNKQQASLKEFPVNSETPSKKKV
jgi:hypothetical protein